MCFYPPEENEIFFSFLGDDMSTLRVIYPSFNRSKVRKVSLAAITFTVRLKPNTLIRFESLLDT